MTNSKQLVILCRICKEIFCIEEKDLDSSCCPYENCWNKETIRSSGWVNAGAYVPADQSPLIFSYIDLEDHEVSKKLTIGYVQLRNTPSCPKNDILWIFYGSGGPHYQKSYDSEIFTTINNITHWCYAPKFPVYDL